MSGSGNRTVYKFPKLETFDIAVAVANYTGTTMFAIEDMVTIDNPVVDHNGDFGSDAPEKRFDGVSNQGGR